MPCAATNGWLKMDPAANTDRPQPERWNWQSEQPRGTPGALTRALTRTLTQTPTPRLLMQKLLATMYGNESLGQTSTDMARSAFCWELTRVRHSFQTAQPQEAGLEPR